MSKYLFNLPVFLTCIKGSRMKGEQGTPGIMGKTVSGVHSFCCFPLSSCLCTCMQGSPGLKGVIGDKGAEGQKGRQGMMVLAVLVVTCPISG